MELSLHCPVTIHDMFFMRSNKIFMACGANVSYCLIVTPSCSTSIHNAAISNPFMASFLLNIHQLAGAVLCIANVAHGNIHVTIVIPNGRHYVIRNYRLGVWPIRLLLVCCYSVAIVNVDVTMLTWWSELFIMNGCPIVVFRCFAMVYKMK